MTTGTLADAPSRWPYIVVAFVLLAFVLFLAWWRRRPVVTPRAEIRRLNPALFTGRFDLDTATAFTRRRLARCLALQDPDLRSLLEWTHGYVRANATPMNGGGPKDGWLLAPNVFEVVQHVRRRTDEAGLDIDDECLWEVVTAHEDYLRSLQS